MVEKRKVPYVCHILVCSNDRQGKRKSCGDGNPSGIRSGLKDAIKDRGWKGRVRVSTTGCMGLCNKGPNVILYPQGVWITGVSEDDIAGILEQVDMYVEHGA